MDLIRCLITDVHQRLLGEIVKKVLEKENSLELVGSDNKVEDLPLLVKKQSVDVLIAGVDYDPFQQLFNGQLSDLSDVMVIGLIDDGRGAVVYLEDIGVDEIIELITMYAER